MGIFYLAFQYGMFGGSSSLFQNNIVLLIQHGQTHQIALLCTANKGIGTQVALGLGGEEYAGRTVAHQIKMVGLYLQ